MTNIPFLILDVFATEKYTGNQLAVCLDAENLTDLQMQQIAREINFSETTFVTSSEPVNGGYNTRIFTPTTELPFAGHPTLGTAFVIARELVGKSTAAAVGETIERIALNYKIGQIGVDIHYRNGEPDILWMHQQQPQFFDRVNVEDLAAVIGVNPTDIDERYPIEPVTTGLPSIIVPLKTIAAVSRAKLDLAIYAKTVATLPAQAILVFCAETVNPDRQLHVRVFTEWFGIPEDPATGSANGCLAAYLAKYQYFGSPKLDITVEQGVEMGRASLLYLRAEYTPTRCPVSIGGRVITIAKGEFIL
ncbi:PhzF family phenazine biosynthesis protein [Chamaesiphon minutus]|uniref:Phenazine biosynthesis protein PhzF family n=1 Tax=Chamaesiphon minutus (strain ATCC 27169 / PCC 6605) TaxID=1173020 RepID=K9UKS8_CHAP6|nr:PhzF family phenazine biosynthesis protein [Chamaesiphon minutus]AFY94774.1 phenazine biosynthesis protein PhzF family [Chamaesiphon minutus PCC 6605]